MHNLARFRGILVAVFSFASILLPSVSSASPPLFRKRALNRQINAVVRQGEAKRGFWGIEVVRLSDGKVLYSRHAEKLFLPASNMKLFTTATALARLGPGFVFRTTIETDSPLDSSGRVKDLILVGRGDPTIGSRALPYQINSPRQSPADKVLQQLADQVVAKGVHEVDGNIIADDTYFVHQPYGDEWAVDDLVWGYGAPVTALAFNDNELQLQITPAALAGQTATASLSPLSNYYKLDNRVVTMPKGAEKQIHIERSPGSFTLKIWGVMPAGGGPETENVAIDNPPRLMGELLRAELEARGVKILGNVQVREISRIDAESATGSTAPETHVVLAEHDSLPLSEDVKLLLKVSENLHAEMLLRTLGHELKNSGTVTAGLQAVREFADAAGVLPDETYFADGSGLSRTVLVTPDAIIKLLEYMAQSPQFNSFFDSLPIAGVDGTLAKRMVNSSAAGRIHAKTGSLEHTNTLSGYMVSPSGKQFAFSILANNNHLDSDHVESDLDQVAFAIYRIYAGRGKPLAAGHGPGSGVTH